MLKRQVNPLNHSASGNMAGIIGPLFCVTRVYQGTKVPFLAGIGLYILKTKPFLICSYVCQKPARVFNDIYHMTTMAAHAKLN